MYSSFFSNLFMLCVMSLKRVLGRLKIIALFNNSIKQFIYFFIKLKVVHTYIFTYVKKNQL